MSLLELLKQKKQDMQASKRKRAAKIPDGKSRWRVLPSWRGEGKQFWHDFGQHFIKDATGAMAAVYVCTERTYGRPCEICSTVAGAIKAAADDATMKLLSDAKAAQRVLVNAIHLDGPNPNEVVVMELAPSLFEQIVAIAAEWEEADQSIFDVKGGKELILERKGTGKQTEYSAQVAAANKFKVPADVLTKLNDLDEYVKQESSEQAQRALNSVRAVAGLLPAPASRGAMPAAAAGAATIVEDDDPYAVATPPKRAAAKVEAEDAVEVTAKPAAKAPAAAAAEAESTGDPELDELLKSV
jgi:hypothetical protein